MTITRTLLAVLASLALAAPAAFAQPADMHASVARAQPKQDLRSPDARDAANAPGATATDAQSLPGPPTRPVNPQPAASTHEVKAAESPGGVDWTGIGSGLAVSVLAVGGIAALAGRRGRTQRPRVSA
jgi:hypothetical protein